MWLSRRRPAQAARQRPPDREAIGLDPGTVTEYTSKVRLPSMIPAFAPFLANLPTG